jgi:flagellar biogenesis protein FliO
MDLLAIMRTLGGLATVLGLLAAALWVVKRYNIRLPGRSFSARSSRLELVESLSIDARRSVALLRRDGREHLILMAPEGNLIIETNIAPGAASDPEDAPARSPVQKAAGSAQTEAFGALVDNIRMRAAPAGRSIKGALGRAAKSSPRSAPAQPCQIGMPIKVLPTGGGSSLHA